MKSLNSRNILLDNVLLAVVWLMFGVQLLFFALTACIVDYLLRSPRFPVLK
jgi:hypothetical protein